jgi:hypothetical protein
MIVGRGLTELSSDTPGSLMIFSRGALSFLESGMFVGCARLGICNAPNFELIFFLLFSVAR